MQRQLAQIVITLDQDVEGAQLDLFVVPARMQRVEIGDARTRSAVPFKAEPVAVVLRFVEPVRAVRYDGRCRQNSNDLSMEQKGAARDSKRPKSGEETRWRSATAHQRCVSAVQKLQGPAS